MTATELIQSIQNCCNGDLRRNVEFAAMFDVSVNTNEDDVNKEVTLRFKDCLVSSNHPNKIQITLV